MRSTKWEAGCPTVVSGIVPRLSGLPLDAVYEDASARCYRLISARFVP